MLRAKLPELCGIAALFRWLIVRFTVLAEAIPRPGTPQFKRFFLWPGRSGKQLPASLQTVNAVCGCPAESQATTAAAAPIPAAAAAATTASTAPQ
jgi:hypothetical protein